MKKEQVLQLLDNYTKRTGKFAIKGFPNKLGLLLHSPPGTGKTSLIKAVAQYTKRHIVTISLGKIKTNQELLDALFDLKFGVHGLDLPVEMSFKDVVFVMEDIDCVSKVVHTRGETTSKPNLKTLAEKMRKSQKKAVEKDNVDDADDVVGGEIDGEPVMGPIAKPKTSGDKLNLSGLLNILDGVIDCPGRIIIMTTNHPEKLDPALIRPGRVNKKLHLNYMSATQAKSLIEYYCTSQLTESEFSKLETIFDGTKFTPALVEEYCAEYVDVNDVLKALEAEKCTEKV